MSYNTKQKKQILKALKNESRNLTIKDIYNILAGEIGLTTIYRGVDLLERDGMIMKVSSEDNSARYRYIEKCKTKDHLYLKCNNCDSLKHIDCEKIQGLTEHMFKDHGFKVTKTHLIINGLCSKCSKRES